MKLIPRLKPSYNFKEIKAALTINRGDIEKFENKFAEKFECTYGVMFSYGRSGLYSLFKVWNLQNDEIICPAYTCVVVPHSIVLSGNIPVFVDCAENSFNMSYEGIEKAITKKTRAVIVTHLFGYPMDVIRVNLIVKKAEEKYQQKIFIIQDCAHSFGAKWNNELVTKYGDAAVFGLNISKLINSIYGGMIITNNTDYYFKLLNYRNDNCKKSSIFKSLKRFLFFAAVYPAFNSYIYGFVNWCERKGFLNRFVKYYDESIIDFPKDWDVMPAEIEARVGLVQLEKYDEIINRRKKNALKYIDEFKDRDDISVLPFCEGATYSHFVAQVEDRNNWVNEYYRKGTQLGILIEYCIPYMKSYKAYMNKDFNISQKYSNHTINFPVWE